MRTEFEIGSLAALRSTNPEPELMRIDHEIGKPYLSNPRIYNSQAWSRRLELPWVLERIGPPRGLRILDVGSGVSALPVLLARRGAKVFSVDPAPAAKGKEERLTVVKGALPRLPFPDESFDVVCCVSVLEHLDASVDDCLGELLRLARTTLLVTFDLSLGPLSRVGLSGVEFRAISKMAGGRPEFPTHPLEPEGRERLAFGPQLGVCLLSMVRENDEWPPFSLSPLKRRLISLHRRFQKMAPALTRPRSIIRWLASRSSLSTTG